MKYLKFLLILTLVTCSSGLCQTIQNVNTNQKYRRTEIHSYKKIGATSDLKFIFLCLPPSNDYQEVSNFDPHGGEIFQSPGSKEKYVRYTITDTEKGEVKLSYDYIQKTTEYSKAAIGRLYPYDTASELYTTYTAKYYDMFDTDNESFKKASENLWKQSSDIYDFAEKCYDYTVENFAFKDNPGVWHSTSELIHYGGGDCGNLATAFITLLRCQKVPARHVITKGHTWAEFYIEKYGWIPIDPTFHLFGKATSSYGIVRANEVFHHIDAGETDLVRDYVMAKNHLFYPDHEGYHCVENVTLEKY